MKKENTTEKVTDIDYAQCAVPAEGRKGFLTMFMIMLGFTFFSASMWVGQQLAEGLDFYGFIKSLILGRNDPGTVYRTSWICRRKDRT